MAERLTDQTLTTAKPNDDDLLHIVKPSVTTDNPSGSSFRIAVGDFLKGRSFVPILGAVVYKMGSNNNPAQIQADDWVIHMSTTTNKLIIGIAKAVITSIPADLNDNTKFDIFLESNKSL